MFTVQASGYVLQHILVKNNKIANNSSTTEAREIY
jgi:hypothetical protein